MDRDRVDQLTLDAMTGREEGMTRVDAATADTWKTEADDFIYRYLLTHRELFCDDLWAAGLPEPPSPRALGPRMLKASKAGWMRKTDRVRPSVRSHMTGKPVWLSLIYTPRHVTQSDI